jgi:integrase
MTTLPREQTMADISAPPVRPARTPATVRDIMRPPAATVEPNDCVAAAAYLMKHAGATALVTVNPQTGPLRRGNFNKMSAWPRAVASIGMPGLHVHDLRHTGNQFEANSGAALRDLMARMGHDSERAAMIYQHEARGADQLITSAIDAHV